MNAKAKGDVKPDRLERSLSKIASALFSTLEEAKADDMPRKMLYLELRYRNKLVRQHIKSVAERIEKIIEAALYETNDVSAIFNELADAQEEIRSSWHHSAVLQEGIDEMLDNHDWRDIEIKQDKSKESDESSSNDEESMGKKLEAVLTELAKID